MGEFCKFRQKKLKFQIPRRQAITQRQKSPTQNFFTQGSSLHLRASAIAI